MSGGRRVKLVVVPKDLPGGERDAGKHYLIKEWSAARADDWVQRLAYAFNRNGGQIPMDLRSIGWEGLAVLGINTFLRGEADPAVMIPLGNELLECVKIVRDPRFPDVATPLIPDSEDVAEVATRWWLRDQVVSVHTGFSFLACLSTLWSAIKALGERKDLPNTQTSPPESGS